MPLRPLWHEPNSHYNELIVQKVQISSSSILFLKRWPHMDVPIAICLLIGQSGRFRNVSCLTWINSTCQAHVFVPPDSWKSICTRLHKEAIFLLLAKHPAEHRPVLRVKSATIEKASQVLFCFLALNTFHNQSQLTCNHKRYDYFFFMVSLFQLSTSACVWTGGRLRTYHKDRQNIQSNLTWWLWFLSSDYQSLFSSTSCWLNCTIFGSPITHVTWTWYVYISKHRHTLLGFSLVYLCIYINMHFLNKINARHCVLPILWALIQIQHHFNKDILLRFTGPRHYCDKLLAKVWYY